MTLGFGDASRLQKLKDELVTWELYQVEIDKYHVMFWFENGHCLLNIAYRFEFKPSDGSKGYVYDVQAPGERKSLNVDCILRRRVEQVEAIDQRRLSLKFDTGDVVVVHDSEQMRSCWFYRYIPSDHDGPLLWFVEDDLGHEEL